jgi:serine/threonine-protein kinase
LAEAHLRLFRGTRDVAELEKASSSAERALQLGGSLAAIHVTRGLVLSALGKHAEAIASIERALAIEPRNADALRELANAYDAAGRSAEAEATFRRAADQRANSWAAYKDLGVFLNQRGRLHEAAASLERVVALTPDSYSAYSNLGGIYLRLGRREEADRMLRKSIELRPTGGAYANLGSLAYVQGRYAEASELYQKATALKPNDDRLWGALGDSYRWIPGRMAEADAATRQALELTEHQVRLDPGEARLRSRRAQYWSSLGEHALAQQEIARAIQAAPTDGHVLFRATIVHEQAGRRKDALRELEEAIAAGFSLEEIMAAPSLRSLRQDPEGTRLIAGRSGPEGQRPR